MGVPRYQVDTMNNPTPIAMIEESINEVEVAIEQAVGPPPTGIEIPGGDRTQSAAWHVRGQIYHTRRLYEHYRRLGDEVAMRVNALLPDSPPDVLVFTSPTLQELLFEFYAFLALARISLDELRHLLRPILVPAGGGSLPKSIQTMVAGLTDCPVLLALRGEPLLRHLIDMRDCLVHHKTFASAQLLIVVKDGPDVDLAPLLQQGWSRPVTVPHYRLTKNGEIVFNVLLPDRIYSYPTPENRGAIASPFTYELGINLLTQTVEYLRFGAYQVLQSISLLREHEGQPFTWGKPIPASNRSADRRRPHAP